jgi:ribosomal protein L37AE/L43A
MKKTLFAVMIIALAVSAHAQLITCESINNVRHTCRVDTNSGITLNRELSKNECVRGQTWGTTRNNDGIWVDGGCRAEFLVGNTDSARLGYGYMRTLTCESIPGHMKRCDAITSNGVQLTRQLSKRSCIENKDWGYDNNGVWVKNGCRAEFALGGNAPMTSSSESTLICESGNGMNHRCNANTLGGVMLSRQLSDNACIQGKTWGWDRNGVWVSDGCRAEFILGRDR